MEFAEEETLDKNIPKFYKILCYFFIYSFIGWVLETLYAFYIYGHFTPRGFLFGPICPIYGYGAIILILFMNTYKNHSIKLFVYASIVFSAFEYFVGFALEAIFGIVWWDYTTEFFNLNGRICAFNSVIWGIFAILFINKIHPFFEKKINKLLEKISSNLFIIILNILLISHIIDTVLSTIKYLK